MRGAQTRYGPPARIKECETHKILVDLILPIILVYTNIYLLHISLFLPDSSDSVSTVEGEDESPVRIHEKREEVSSAVRVAVAVVEPHPGGHGRGGLEDDLDVVGQQGEGGGDAEAEVR